MSQKGIYKITGESYIGQTNNLNRRKQEHFTELSLGSHHNKGMQTDYNNGDRFTFTVLENINGTRHDLHEKEKEYIRQYNTFYRGYNQTPGGEYDKLKGSYQNGGGRKITYTPTYNYFNNNYAKSNYNSNYSSNTNSDSILSKDDKTLETLCCLGMFLLMLLGTIL